MIFNMTNGGSGGASLNFKVVGGTTEPTSPSENMIWVNTDAEITSWIFSSTAPETPEEGMVWFLASTSSDYEFNALKKDGIQVYPAAAKQYIESAWKDVVASSYQNDKFNTWWNGVLFDAGNQYDAITGGWKGVNGEGYSYSIGTAMTLTRVTAGDNAALYTNKKINVTKYNRLTVVFNDVDIPVVWEGNNLNIGLTSANTGSYPGMVARTSTSARGAQTLNVDISSITGEFYVCIAVNIMTCNVAKVYLS